MISSFELKLHRLIYSSLQSPNCKTKGLLCAQIWNNCWDKLSVVHKCWSRQSSCWCQIECERQHMKTRWTDGKYATIKVSAPILHLQLVLWQLLRLYVYRMYECPRWKPTGDAVNCPETAVHENCRHICSLCFMKFKGTVHPKIKNTFFPLTCSAIYQSWYCRLGAGCLVLEISAVVTQNNPHTLLGSFM